MVRDFLPEVFLIHWQDVATGFNKDLLTPLAGLEEVGVNGPNEIADLFVKSM
jgi:hypothetical protein